MAEQYPKRFNVNGTPFVEFVTAYGMACAKRHEIVEVCTDNAGHAVIGLSGGRVHATLNTYDAIRDCIKDADAEPEPECHEN